MISEAARQIAEEARTCNIMMRRSLATPGRRESAIQAITDFVRIHLLEGGHVESSADFKPTIVGAPADRPDLVCTIQGIPVYLTDFDDDLGRKDCRWVIRRRIIAMHATPGVRLPQDKSHGGPVTDEDRAKIAANLRTLRDTPAGRKELAGAIADFVRVRLREEQLVDPGHRFGPAILPSDPDSKLLCTVEGLPIYLADFDSDDCRAVINNRILAGHAPAHGVTPGERERIQDDTSCLAEILGGRGVVVEPLLTPEMLAAMPVSVDRHEFTRLKRLESLVADALTQKGDDVCWRDIYNPEVAKLVGVEGFDPQLLPEPEFVDRNCRHFHRCLKSGEPYATPEPAATAVYLFQVNTQALPQGERVDAVSSLLADLADRYAGADEARAYLVARTALAAAYTPTREVQP